MAASQAGFKAVSAADTGILWTNTITEEQVTRRYNMVSGAGVAAGDYDGDGLCDLYFCNRGGDNALFRNLGSGKFQNVTAAAGVACAGQSSTGATFADINGDGLLDLLVSSFWGPNACFMNAGNGTFTNATQTAGLLPRGGATSLALADIDGDGDLDLYFTYFGIESIVREGGRISFGMSEGKPIVTGRYARRLKIEGGQLVELGEQDVLYLNDGQGRFTAVDWAGAFRNEDGQPVSAAPMDFGLSVQLRDMDGNGFPDIYTCNDFQTPDRLWLNEGHGRFRAAPLLALRNMSYASMGVDFADIDRDGRLDFVTVEMLSRDHARRLRQMSSMPVGARHVGEFETREAVPRNALYWNRGDGTYAEIACFSGVAASDWSWTPIFLDVDLDGFEDLLIPNGSLYDVMDRDASAAAAKLSTAGQGDPRKVLPLYPALDTPNAAFRNRGDLTFEDVGQRWGFDSRLICQGVACVDLDNDGDLDVVMNCANAAPLVCLNQSSANRIAVRLKGLPPNTQGIGARISLSGGAVALQTQEIVCGGRYLSSDQAMRVFAAGSATNLMRITVTWPSRKTSVVDGVAPNWIYEIDEAGASAGPVKQVGAEPSPWFADVSDALHHVHHENDFNDFERQPLLPRKLSQPGPGVAWLDFDEDGWDDLVVGGGQGGRIAVFRNDQKGGFKRLEGKPWDEELARDLTGLAGAGRFLLAGVANYEEASQNDGSVRLYDARSGTVEEAVPFHQSSVGPLSLTDMDGDGKLEAFVGGRVVSARYPMAASSAIVRQELGKWVLDQQNTSTLANIGLVSGAVWSDLDGNGFPELILACEWGPLRIYRNLAGKLEGWRPRVTGSRASTFDELTGWWNGVAVGDFDGDGRMDIVASNWGLNSLRQASPERPLKLYFGNIAGRGNTDLIECYVDSASNAEVPERDLDTVAASFPFLRSKFPTHAAYAQSTMRDIYGDKLRQLRHVTATTLATMVFLNRGDHFEATPLPAEAQFSPAFAVCVADADGDGNDDLFLCQNFFATRSDEPRLDAGRGLWLAGDGRGTFKSVPGQRSGICVYGEQRGAAVSDFDRDGRVDLVLTQNGAATKLYRNLTARPALRVRLQGLGENSSGLAAQVRLVGAGWQGPMKEVHAGSGYLSQDSVVQLLSRASQATKVWVRWPGGSIMEGELPPDAREIEVAHSGGITKIH